jgi:hypothetical protein
MSAPIPIRCAPETPRAENSAVRCDEINRALGANGLTGVVEGMWERTMTSLPTQQSSPIRLKMPRAIEVVTSWHGPYGEDAGDTATMLLRTHCGQRASTVVSHYHAQEAREDLWAWWTEHQRHCHHCRATEELRWLLYEGYVFQLEPDLRTAYVRNPQGTVYRADYGLQGWRCGCPSTRECKHLRALRSRLPELQATHAREAA